MFEPADIAACYGGDRTSRVIQLATCSPFAPPGLRWPPSHVAILCDRDDGPVWVEATTLCSRPCLIRGRITSGLQAHRPADRIEDYVRSGGRVVLYRLTDLNRLSTEETALLRRILLEHLLDGSRVYDYRGAILSGTRAFQRSRLFPGCDLDELFCSELIAAVLMRLNRMNHDNPGRFHPGRLLRRLVQTGKYRAVRCFPDSHAACGWLATEVVTA